MVRLAGGGFGDGVSRGGTVLDRNNGRDGVGVADGPALLCGLLVLRGASTRAFGRFPAAQSRVRRANLIARIFTRA